MPDNIGDHHGLAASQTDIGRVDPHVEMDIIGAIEGSDKSSAHQLAWDYLRHYDEIFAEYRHRPINLLEVGVQGGPSIRLWKWYFSAAHIVGIDINPACATMAEPRVTIEIGSQADGPFLSRVCADYPPTIFIDDGSHLAQHNVFTFEHVFPLLLPGGIYVVEDLAFHFGPNASEWQLGPDKCDVIDYFLEFGRMCMARRAPKIGQATSATLSDMVDSVTFFGSAAVIRKKRAVRQIGEATTLARHYIAEKGLEPGAHARLAAYLLRHGGKLEEAEAACNAALASGPSLEAMKYLADIMMRTGRTEAARQVLIDAAAIPTKSWRAKHDLARMQVQAGLKEEAATTLQAILARNPNRPMSRQLLDRLQGKAAESGKKARAGKKQHATDDDDADE